MLDNAISSNLEGAKVYTCTTRKADGSGSYRGIVLIHPLIKKQAATQTHSSTPGLAFNTIKDEEMGVFISIYFHSGTDLRNTFIVANSLEEASLSWYEPSAFKEIDLSDVANTSTYKMIYCSQFIYK